MVEASDEDRIAEYEDGEVHTVDGPFRTGHVVMYRDWVHVVSDGVWLPRDQVEQVIEES